MSTNKFTDEFKQGAVAQVVDGGYSVRELAERLWVGWLATACAASVEK